MAGMNYTIRSAAEPPRLDPNWQDPIWSRADTLEIQHFRPESSDHHPRAFARLLHSADGIHRVFQVHDRYVRCVRAKYFDEVWKDSCVEFFAQPKAGCGYFNLEFNCGGAFLCSYITNPERVPGGFKEFVKLPPALGRQSRCALPCRDGLTRRLRNRWCGPWLSSLRSPCSSAMLDRSRKVRARAGGELLQVRG